MFYDTAEDIEIPGLKLLKTLRANQQEQGTRENISENGCQLQTQNSRSNGLLNQSASLKILELQTPKESAFISEEEEEEVEEEVDGIDDEDLVMDDGEDDGVEVRSFDVFDEDNDNVSEVSEIVSEEDLMCGMSGPGLYIYGTSEAKRESSPDLSCDNPETKRKRRSYLLSSLIITMDDRKTNKSNPHQVLKPDQQPKFMRAKKKTFKLPPRSGGVRVVVNGRGGRPKGTRSLETLKAQIKKEQQQKLSQANFDAARASRLVFDTMSEKEKEVFSKVLKHFQVPTYLSIRNSILRLWLKNPRVALSLDGAMTLKHDHQFDDRYDNLIHATWEFLVRYSYINYGFLEPFKNKPIMPIQLQILGPPLHLRQKTVIVIGAGMAGISCARQLFALFTQFSPAFAPHPPPKIIVLEARGRIGGRVFSYPLHTSIPSEWSSQLCTHNSSVNFPRRPPGVDLGAQIITGFEGGNPMDVIVKQQLQLPLHLLVNNYCDLHDIDGEKVQEDLDKKCDGFFNEILERACGMKRNLQGWNENMVKFLKERGDKATTDITKGESLDEESAKAVQQLNIDQPVHHHDTLFTKADRESSEGLEELEENRRMNNVQGCVNCGVTESLTWRTGENGEKLCNGLACGLYFHNYSNHRQHNRRCQTSSRFEFTKPALTATLDDSSPAIFPSISALIASAQLPSSLSSQYNHSGNVLGGATAAVVKSISNPPTAQAHLAENIKPPSITEKRQLRNQVVATLGNTMDYFLEHHPSFSSLTPAELRTIHWHYANLEFANATPLNTLSLDHWDQDDGFEFHGHHAMIMGGYGQVPHALALGPVPLDLRLRKPVQAIEYNRKDEDGYLVKVTCRDNETLLGDAVVVTAPLGVLKDNSIRFEPPLPAWKTGAIARLGFGLLNKLVLVFPFAFWDTKADMFGSIAVPAGNNDGDAGRKGYDRRWYSDTRGKFYMFWNSTAVSGLPVLVGLMAGSSAHTLEAATDAELVTDVLEVLQRIFPTVLPLPTPVETLVTRWKQDEFAKGSYSYVGPEGTGADYDLLAKPVDGGLFWGGEASNRNYPATVHGAYMSGCRAASEVFGSFVGEIGFREREMLFPTRE